MSLKGRVEDEGKAVETDLRNLESDSRWGLDMGNLVYDWVQKYVVALGVVPKEGNLLSSDDAEAEMEKELELEVGHLVELLMER